MKIIQATAMADSRGAGVASVVQNITNALVTRDHEVAVFGRVADHQTAGVLAQTPHVVPVNTSLAAAQAVNRSDGAILHSHGLWDPYLTAQIVSARRRGIPVIISPHGMLDAWALRESRLKKWLALKTYEGRNLSKAACIHALTEAECRDIQAIDSGVPVAVIPNGLPLPPENLLAEREHEEKVLLFLSRLHPKKGVCELVKAFASLTGMASATRWRLDIAGWDDAGILKDLKSLVDTLGVSEQVRFLGPVFGKDKKDLLDEATAFVLPSYSEGLPMAVLEAWAFGKPVLMTRECNLPEAENAGAAIICGTGTRAIAEGLKHLFEKSTDERVAMGRSGRALVKARYDLSIVAGQFERLYEWVSGIGKVPEFVQIQAPRTGEAE